MKGAISVYNAWHDSLWRRGIMSKINVPSDGKEPFWNVWQDLGKKADILRVTWPERRGFHRE